MYYRLDSSDDTSFRGSKGIQFDIKELRKIKVYIDRDLAGTSLVKEKDILHNIINPNDDQKTNR